MLDQKKCGKVTAIGAVTATLSTPDPFMGEVPICFASSPANGFGGIAGTAIIP